MRTIALMDDRIMDGGGAVYFSDGTALGYYGGKYSLYQKGDTLGDGKDISVEQAFRKFDADFDKLVTEAEFYKEVGED